MLVKRTFRHWTPRYLIDRAGVMLFERKYPDAPWLTQAMVNLLDSWLKPTDRGLEWGSGRSTVWFARRVEKLISVEHDPKWAEIVRKRLKGVDLAGRVEYHLELDEREGEFSAYVKVADTLGSGSLDFCLIDGISRDHCALACLDKVRPGGIVIVDNVEWYLPCEPRSRAPNSRGLKDGYASKGWRAFAERISDWRCVWTTNGIWDTALWIKP